MAKKQMTFAYIFSCGNLLITIFDDTADNAYIQNSLQLLHVIRHQCIKRGSDNDNSMFLPGTEVIKDSRQGFVDSLNLAILNMKKFKSSRKNDQNILLRPERDSDADLCDSFSRITYVTAKISNKYIPVSKTRNSTCFGKKKEDSKQHTV